MLGENVIKTIEVFNEGKLGGEIKFWFELDEFEEDSDEISLKSQNENQVYKLEGNSIFSIPIQFSPSVPGNSSKLLKISIAKCFLVSPWETVQNRSEFEVAIKAVPFSRARRILSNSRSMLL